MTISTERQTLGSRNLVDICGTGNENTLLAYRNLADYSILLAETILVMQDSIEGFKAAMPESADLPKLPEYLNVKGKVIVDVEDMADAPDPLVHGDTVQLDLEQFIKICKNVPPMCWSHFVGTTDKPKQINGFPVATLTDLANELEDVSSDAAVAIRAFIEKNCPKNWEVKFSRLVEQDFTIIVQAATEQEAKDEVLMYGIDASHSYQPDWDDEREYEVCANIESVEETDEEI